MENAITAGVLIRAVHVALMGRCRRVITNYLDSHAIKKLWLGASNNLLPDWLGTDVSANHKLVIYLDAVKPFPLRATHLTTSYLST